jgi:hypothetical protein
MGYVQPNNRTRLRLRQSPNGDHSPNSDRRSSQTAPRYPAAVNIQGFSTPNYQVTQASATSSLKEQFDSRQGYACNSSLPSCRGLWIDFRLRGSVFLPALLLSLRDCRATLRSHLLLWGPGARLPTQPLAFRRAIHAAVLLILFFAHEERRCARWILADLQPSEVPKQPTTCFRLTGSPLFGNG